jgi:hypothetical protein
VNLRVPRFGLKILLALPLCVAAFYYGYTAHRAHQKSRYDLENDAALKRNADIYSELSHQRAIEANRFQNSVYQREHQEQMQNYHRLLKDPHKMLVQP